MCPQVSLQLFLMSLCSLLYEASKNTRLWLEFFLYVRGSAKEALKLYGSCDVDSMHAFHSLIQQR